MEANRNYYTVAETAELCGMSISYVNKLIADGKINAVKDPQVTAGSFKYQIPAKEVDRLLEARHGVIEAKNEEKGNTYITVKELAKVAHRSAKLIKEDAHKGKLVITHVGTPGARGYRDGVQIDVAKKYLRNLKASAPKFITAAELEEMMK